MSALVVLLLVFVCAVSALPELSVQITVDQRLGKRKHYTTTSDDDDDDSDNTLKLVSGTSSS